MKLKDITSRSDCETRSDHPAVQEMIERFNDHVEIDCRTLDEGHRAFVGAVYMDVTENPGWRPTPHILSLIQDINGRMAAWSDATDRC